jgi:serine/threonine-protein kinase RsbW
MARAGWMVTAGMKKSYATLRDDGRSPGANANDDILCAGMTVNGRQVVRLEFTSALEMVDFVQVVSDHIGRTAGLDEDTIHWVGVAIRESVVNAIKHGNRNDSSKHVFVEFQAAQHDGIPDLTISVRDQGEGFDPEAIANPLEPENLLKSSGRGIFLIRNFMDEVSLQRAPEGGMEIRMVKRVQPGGADAVKS